MVNLGSEYLDGAKDLMRKRDELRLERERKKGSSKYMDRRINVLSEEIRYMENVGNMLISEAKIWEKRRKEERNGKNFRRI